ncbi:MAG: hypothetical protein GXO95_03780 [Nitrospirae bacterium]|nr:hypothetical protein [Nitrospirota bacterium]
MKNGGKLLIITLMFLSLAVVLTSCGCGNSTHTYTVGGTVTGLAPGKFVVLQNNGRDDLTVTQDGSFTFATALANGASYNVTVKTQPAGQSCTVSNNTGTISGADVTDVTVVCYDSGTLDTTFGTNGVVTYDSGYGYDYGESVTVDSNGKILVAGTSYNGDDSDMTVLRINADGSPDTSFGTNGVVTYDSGDHDYGYSVTVDSNGEILVTGYISNGGVSDMAVLRFNADGSPDTSFGTNGVVTYDSGYGSRGESITVDSNGKILVAGTSYNFSDSDMTVWRFNTDGSPDTTFGTNGVVTYDSGYGNDYGESVTVDLNGKILVAGTSYNGDDSDMTVLRINADGLPDTSFGIGSIVTYDSGYGDYGYSVTVDSNGKILVAGYIFNGADSDITVLRFNTDGSPDTTFGTNGVATYDGGYGYSITVDSNGEILVTGYISNGGVSDMAVLRFNTDGSPDTTFGTNGVATYDSGDGHNAGKSVTVDSNGKILVAGTIYKNRDSNMTVWRFNP